MGIIYKLRASRKLKTTLRIESKSKLNYFEIKIIVIKETQLQILLNFFE